MRKWKPPVPRFQSHVKSANYVDGSPLPNRGKAAGPKPGRPPPPSGNEYSQFTDVTNPRQQLSSCCSQSSTKAVVASESLLDFACGDAGAQMPDTEHASLPKTMPVVPAALERVRSHELPPARLASPSEAMCSPPPIRPKTTTPIRAPTTPLTPRPATTAASPRNPRLSPSSNSEKLQDQVIAAAGVMRAQTKLFDLLGTASWVTQPSREPVFNEESRQPYQKFLRGFVGSSPKHVQHRTLLAESLTDIVGHRYDSDDDQPIIRYQMGGDDHYNYFAGNIPSDSASREDNGRRLHRARMQLLGVRSVLRSKQAQKAKGASLSGTANSSSTALEVMSPTTTVPMRKTELPMGADHVTSSHTPPPLLREDSSGQTSQLPPPLVWDSSIASAWSSDQETSPTSVPQTSRRRRTVTWVTKPDESQDPDEDAGPASPRICFIDVEEIADDGEQPPADGAARTGFDGGRRRTLVDTPRGNARRQTITQKETQAMGAKGKKGRDQWRGTVYECAVIRGRAKRRQSKHSSFSLNSAAATANLKAEMRTREACESLRFLVFGYNNEDKRLNGAYYDQACGSKEEVMQLHKIWTQMDEDGSGDVEFQEFLSFFSRNKADRLLGMKCVKYLVGYGNRDGEEKGGCTIDDMMRLIWLKATDIDINLMMNWFKEAEYHRHRAPTPRLLSKRKRREILENFPSLELGAKISYMDLVDNGLCDEPTAKSLQQQYDVDNSNIITEDRLVDMMCPNGYRSRKGAVVAVDSEGRKLEYVDNEFFVGWIYSETDDKDD